MPTTTIALFTRDLRIHDNPVLDAARRGANYVVPLFVHDDRLARTGFAAGPRARFLNECLADLDAGLRGRGAALIEHHGDVVREVCALADRLDATEVHIAADASAFAARRRNHLADALARQRRALVVHEAVHTVLPAGRITPQGKDHFAVFSPYFRRWQQTERRDPAPAPRRLDLPPDIPAPEPPTRTEHHALHRGGETEGLRRTRNWLAADIDRYTERADDLAADATSKLSPYLHFGCVSALDVAVRAAEHGSEGANAFVRQLAWRDFHYQCLAARPQAAHADYRSRGDDWRDDPEALQAWQTGQTGIPIVDAGMRQLAAEGWMHNRARLIAGSFLTKTLYLDWRAGAAHFLDHLVDGDVASNQLNWQWVAGTGTDTRPNRVLNPLRQAERYDPTGDYTRRWVPELADLDDRRDVHQPWRLGETALRALGYPAPLVDLDAARERFQRQRAPGR